MASLWRPETLSRAALLAGLLVAGLPGRGLCGDVAGAPAPRSGTLELGALLTLSPTGDPDTQAAVRLAVTDVNTYFRFRHARAGRSSRLRLRLHAEGTGLDPVVARERIERLARKGLTIVIGPESSAEVEAIKPFTDAHRMVVISHCSTAPSLALPDDSIYRMVPNDGAQGIALARRMIAQGHRAVVPLWREGTWGDDIASATLAEVRRLGGTVSPGVRFDPGRSDFTEELTVLSEQLAAARAASGGDAAVALFCFGTEGAAMLAQAAGFPGLGEVQWYGADGTALSREILNDPQAARFAAQTRFLNTLFAEEHTPLANAVRTRIRAAIGGGSVHFCALAAYDAVWLAALSAAAVGDEDPDAFVEAFADLARRYRGVTGPATLDAAGDRSLARYEAWRVQEVEGRYEWRPEEP